jgi:ribosomal protein L36
MQGISSFFNGGGKHCLHIEGGFQILGAVIDNCSFGKGSHADAHSIYVIDNLAHSRLESCGFETAYMQCFDANLITKCLMFGAGTAVTFDCENGVRNNTVADCTLVNRDGAVHIINGDNIRIKNNQIELATGYTPSTNQSATSSMVWVQGVDRPVYNTIIEENNFGGGTNLDHLVYLDNAQRTVVDENNFIAVNVAEVYLTANAQYNVIGTKNRTNSQVSNPRLGTLFKAKVTDLGVGNMGVLKSGPDYDAGDWAGADFWKDEGGMVNFIGTFSAGTTTGGTVMANLPSGYRPYIQSDTVKRNLLTYTEQIDNAVWTKSSMAAITANAAVAPDSETTADLAVVQATTAFHLFGSSQFALTDSTQYVASFYVKRADGGSANSIRYEIENGSTTRWVRGLVDLTTGVVTATGNATYFSGVSASSVDAGNGWWRVSVVFTTVVSGAASATYRILVTPNNVASIYTSYLGDPVVHMVLAWGFQAEQNSAVTAYQRVVDALTFETVFASRKLLATTDAGVGYVDITRQGILSVGSLPSNVAVGIESFQAAATQT